MRIYFRPFAGSLAARIACLEGELDAEFVLVEQGMALPDGRDLRDVSPLGYVPALETPAGFRLSETPAVLSYIAELAPEGVLAPVPFSDAHYRMLAWLALISSELHKGVFDPLMRKTAAEAERATARWRAARPFALLSRHLEAADHLEGGFSVADAYLLTVLNWCEHAGLSLEPWPVLRAWRHRLRARPSVARAMAEEYPLLRAA
ncbi:glutathione S-transferase N-terminal domain-containing protein [Sphingomonas sp.]|uniref:glutathione S-transferase family protein n=1 Tax=Sphingomonas sp. TaxID=28214 RepID=UPI001B2A1E71|nr:glutathione S-transferase N-terminal domain-containing protein [Sphingomonas sp.]MBO9714068.1 glutathione S-transferase family protein [Sphingomonas sp.]